jgi:hypothetical protein
MYSRLFHATDQAFALRSFCAALVLFIVPMLIAAACSGVAFAQRRGFGGDLASASTLPARYAPEHMPDGDFVICRLSYSSVRREEGGIGGSPTTCSPRSTSPPAGRDHEDTSAATASTLNYYVVRLTDDALFNCPMIGLGRGHHRPRVRRSHALRNYLLKGGFLWVDDFWGSQAWAQWTAQVHKALPEYSIVDIPREHAIRNMMFPVEQIPQVTNIQNWRQSGGNTQEQGSDSPYADFRMLADEKGRVMVVMTHNTDIGDSFEREGEDHEFFIQFSPRGYALGVDVLLYSLTH